MGGHGLGSDCDHINHLGYHVKEKVVLKAWGDIIMQKFSQGGAIKNFLGSCGGKHKTSVLYLEVPRGGEGGKQISTFKGGKPPPTPLKETLLCLKGLGRTLHVGIRRKIQYCAITFTLYINSYFTLESCILFL